MEGRAMLVCTQQLSRFCLTMATINIKASTVNISEKRAAEICGILGEIGVEFSFIPSYNPNQRRGHLKFTSLCISVRCQRALRTACELNGLDYEHTCISEFVEKIPRNELLKVRNLGKRALEEIERILYDNGYSLRATF